MPLKVLLDDSRDYVQRAIAADVDARVDVWIGMPHVFAGRIGVLKASGEALQAIGVFLRLSCRSGEFDRSRVSEHVVRVSCGLLPWRIYEKRNRGCWARHSVS